MFPQAGTSHWENLFSTKCLIISMKMILSSLSDVVLEATPCPRNGLGLGSYDLGLGLEMALASGPMTLALASKVQAFILTLA